MENLRFYYRFKPIGVDYTCEKDIKKYSKLLNSFNDLKEQFAKLQNAFDNKDKERADIAINVLPDISGVMELIVYHKIKHKLFSKDIKKQCFCLCLTKYEPPKRLHSLYEYETTDVKEVENLFRDLIINHSIPNLNNWKCIL